MYSQFAPLVDRYLLTNIRKVVADADTFFDSAVLGDPDRWTQNVIERGVADEDNEADYEIIELVAKDAGEIAARRARMLREWESRFTQRPRSERRISSASGMDLLPL